MFLRKNIFLMFVLSFSLFGFVNAGNPDDVKKIKDETEFDLECCSLENEKLKEVVAWGKNFNYGNLSSANFKNAKFNFEKEEEGDFPSCFCEATLIKTIFNGACLRNCDFNSADLRGAKFIGANLKGADFRYALFDKDTVFLGAKVEGAKFEGVIFNNCSKRCSSVLLLNLVRNGANTPEIRKKTPSPNLVSVNEQEEKKNENEEATETLVEKLERLAIGYSETKKSSSNFNGICPWNM